MWPCALASCKLILARFATSLRSLFNSGYVYDSSLTCEPSTVLAMPEEPPDKAASFTEVLKRTSESLAPSLRCAGGTAST